MLLSYDVKLGLMTMKFFGNRGEIFGKLFIKLDKITFKI